MKDTCKSCERIMKIDARGLCSACYRHQRFIENPAYAATRRAQEREAKRERRLKDETWAEAERAKDRTRVRTYVGSCTLCDAPGIVAKGLCRRCYGRTWMQERRAIDPGYAAAGLARNAIRISENSEAVRIAKDVPCADCGGRFPLEAMDLDHVRGKKLFSLSNAGARTLGPVLAEIAKCDAICANCHRVRTKARAVGAGMC